LKRTRAKIDGEDVYSAEEGVALVAGCVQTRKIKILISHLIKLVTEDFLFLAATACIPCSIVVSGVK